MSRSHSRTTVTGACARQRRRPPLVGCQVVSQDLLGLEDVGCLPEHLRHVRDGQGRARAQLVDPVGDDQAGD
ncbi:hypothetical protein [Streptomyces sp. NRRL S-920]|uniref:hypothetical protein n=1 Tax=Streptomyces sp. NRRL S-920 TaxID=1463921 RepID=UPI001F1EF01A|nr:hypothetical protein [Streptomyces sp. NRRL S-920]